MPLGQDEEHGVVEQVLAVDPVEEREGLVLPLVAEHEIDLAEWQRGKRLLGLGLDELAAERRRLVRQHLHRRDREVEGGRLERRDARTSGDGAGDGGELGLRALRPLEQGIRVADEHAGGVRQPNTATGALEQRDARLALEHRKLLRDRRRREAKRLGDRRDRAARLELPEEPQSAEIEQGEEMLTNEHDKR